jgi:peptidyl-prolyl cis-trans isomerase B (cyclophilin B)
MKKIFLAFVVAAIMVGCGGQAEQTKPRRVEMKTTAGNIVLELSDLTPIHRDNFMQLVEEHYFDSLLFHRVIENFMIQGGDPRTRHISGKDFFAEGEETGDARYWEDIPAEICYPELYHHRGALAAAREGDDVNPQRRSSRTQFYIVWGRIPHERTLEKYRKALEESSGGQHTITQEMKQKYAEVGGAPYLDGHYTVFGEVVEGLIEVVYSMQFVETDENDRPLGDIRIIKAVIE